MSVKDKLHYYNAHIRSIYDADTVRADIDFGLSMWMRNYSIRLFGINAPEVRGPEKEQGLVCRDALRELLTDKDVIVKSIKWDKYGGRIDGEIYLGDLHVNQWLVDNGYAVEREY